MTAQGFRYLTKEEFGKLSLEQRMSYMQELLEYMRIQLAETRQQIEDRKKRFEPSE